MKLKLHEDLTSHQTRCSVINDDATWQMERKSALPSHEDGIGQFCGEIRREVSICRVNHILPKTRLF